MARVAERPTPVTTFVFLKIQIRKGFVKFKKQLKIEIMKLFKNLKNK